MDLTWIRLKAVARARLIRLPSNRVKENVSATRAWKRTSRSMLLYQLTWAWRQVWSKIFRNDRWHRWAKKAGLMPALVGGDLHRLSEDDRATPKLLVLAVPRPDEMADISTQLFLDSLRSHTYDPFTNQLTFVDWNLVINVCSLSTHDKIILDDPTGLFHAGERLTTTVLCYEAEANLRDIRPGLFGGLCKGLPRSMADVNTVCSVALKYGNGMPVYQRFEKPRCPPVREIMATYREEDIGPWRFDKLVLKLDHYDAAWGNDSRRKTWPHRQN